MRGELSQSALADRMRERGWKWSQATVWSVEQGERPLRLAEAVDLAEVLGGRVPELLGSERANAARMVRTLVEETVAALVEVSRHGAWVLSYQEQLAKWLDELRAVDDEHVDEELVAAAEKVLAHRLGAEVEEAANRLRRARDGERR